MKKKIMQTFAALICAYGLLTAFSIFNLSKVEGMLERSGTVDTEFYRAILELSDQAKSLQKFVASSFVYTRSDQIDESIHEIQKEFKIMSEDLELIKGDKFSDIHKYKIKSDDDVSDSSSGKEENDEKELTVGDLIRFLETELHKLETSSLNVVASTKDILNTKRALSDKNEELSKSFRKIDFSSYLSGDDSTKARKQLSNLTRAVMVVMFSDSVGDLSFAGKGKFNAATKYWDEALGKDENYLKFKEIFNESIELALTAAANTSDQVFFKFNQASYQFIDGIKKIKGFSETLFSETQEDILSDVSFTNQISVIVSLLVLIVGTVFSWITLNRLTESLKKIIVRVTDDSGSVASIASKVKSSADTLSESVSRQGAAIQETVSSMQEISSMISRTTEQSKTSNDETRKLVQSMEDLKETNRNLQQLESTFKSIESKTKVINDIVFKTQLLSFNASIEAARAGAHGKGFAVVAQEVGKLAELSGSAAKEINGLLSDSDSQIRDTVEQTSERIERFEAALNQVSMATESINQASYEQENGVQQTNVAMDQMDGATQENSANAEELMKISDDLQDNSRNLQAATRDLNQIVAGKKEAKDSGESGLVSAMAMIFDFKKLKDAKGSDHEKNKDHLKTAADHQINGDDDSFKPAV